jgi:hypothetical protein
MAAGGRMLRIRLTERTGSGRDRRQPPRDLDRTDTGHHLAFRQVTVADNPRVAVCGLQIGMLAEKF